MTTTVLIAGATGTLGSRIAFHLLEQQDVSVRLLSRQAVPADADKAQVLRELVARGASVAVGDLTDPTGLDAATAGVDTVVSAVQGGPDVIVDGQLALAESAVRSGARRFVPSDFALDLFSEAADGAPQFEARRRARSLIDPLPLEVVHVLPGGFMDMMLDPSSAGVIDVRGASATLWGTGDERFDLTTVEDTARFTARAATDPGPVPAVLRLSGERTTFNEIIAETERITGTPITRTVLGSADDLRRTVAAAEDPWTVLREWYALALLSVPPFTTTDNDRYPELRPTGLRDHLVSAHRRTT